MNSNKKKKKEFLRALFDDEGSIIKERNRGIIKLYSINSEGLGQIQNILLEFDISTKLYPGYGLKRNVYALIVRDLELFNKQIGFGLKRKQDKLNELTS